MNSNSSVELRRAGRHPYLSSGLKHILSFSMQGNGMFGNCLVVYIKKLNFQVTMTSSNDDK